VYANNPGRSKKGEARRVTSLELRGFTCVSSGLFKNDSPLGQLIADAVRRGEIAPLARGLPLGYQGLNFSVAERRGIWGEAQRAQFFHIVIVKHGKNGVEGFERGEDGGGITLTKFPTIHGCVHVAHQIENCRQRLGSIQIIRKSAVKIFQRLRSSTRHLRGGAFREYSGSNAPHKRA
jgi:hypothetical protein